MFCPNCGSKLEDDSLFCNECGTALDGPLDEGDDSDKTELVEDEVDFGENSTVGNLDEMSDPFAASSSPSVGFADAAVDTTLLAPDDNQHAAAIPAAAAMPQAAPAKSGGNKAVLAVAITAIVAVLAVAAVAFFFLRPQAPATYGVQFETDGGTVVAAQQVEKGTQVTSPSNPTKSGYEFAGWYFNPECTDQATFPLAVDDNIVLYAKWEEKKDSSEEKPSSASGNSTVSATVGSSSASSASSTNAKGSYIIPNSSDERLSRGSLESLSDDDLAIAMNEIWARHGRQFKNNWLQSYFESQPWYKGTIAAEDFLNHYTPTAVEDENAKLISAILTERGYDVNKRHPN